MAQNRDFGVDPRRLMNINVMLNKSDQTDFLKLSRTCLEVSCAAARKSEVGPS